MMNEERSKAEEYEEALIPTWICQVDEMDVASHTFQAQVTLKLRPSFPQVQHHNYYSFS